MYRIILDSISLMENFTIPTLQIPGQHKVLLVWDRWSLSEYTCFWYVLRVFVEVLTISELEYLQYVLKYVFINLQFPPSVTCFTTLFTTTWIKSSCYSFIAFSVYCISHHWSQHFDLKMLSGLKDDADDVDLSPHVPELVMDFSKVLCFE